MEQIIRRDYKEKKHMKMGIIYVVATPIGNLKDITLRALDILKSVDVILAEDTRVVKKLLSRYEIRKPVWRCDANTELETAEKVLSEIKEGKSFALVSDAGTPAVSDPGARLVRRMCEAGASLVPIPGASAITAILSVAGISADSFTFLGYPPHKKGRETFFKNIGNISARPLVFYESPYRIKKTIGEIGKNLGENAEIVIGRELTKIHEEIFRGTVGEATGHFTGERERGEFVVIIK
ncbi:MAG: Ribosomal RNA small subunit methyltransferase I [Candidatus Jorgensenbacteria bacterium GW2011_GWA2_45_9]|uniref:Ribosomal RNA small subunit methyltransferase I n=2 Tax=Candidatus Joergenseniibacteriota TaxID=1752739 RepID=A0A0G1QD41_9BACT|nr:MAG: Ribosomal RNA small subunit methyltransferase I [Candidatus Jorgensenbacteria bacterium GW2011_GWA2_45_9]